ncbi:hypothetical protein FNF27_03934 [Cafeteria roenbergensis]|uniref:Lipase maturation factor 2 n=1 Tax=Cafeteria roenbergensis TaxID=33653 RepID=A0A5A8EF31_CAFRO|nr:hypothetical protein FNF27_03934 [Cafeteria roenbergensis]
MWGMLCGCGWSARAADKLLLLIALVAFASLAQQVRGVLGADGIEAVGETLLGFANWKAPDFAPAQVFRVLPTLLWWAPKTGLPFETALEVLLLVGTCTALLGIALGGSTLLFLVLWGLYLSVFVSGGTMLSFQWDMLLLEALFAAALHAPLLPEVATAFLRRWLWPSLGAKPGAGMSQAVAVAESAPPSTHSVSARWLLRALLVKLMLMAGAVKIQSQCPTWLGLTALAVHFQGQCLPHALSWWAAQAPPLLLKAGVAATLLIEGPMVPLLAVPIWPVRAVAAWLQVLLQLAIVLTGNYNFFNVLTMLLAVYAAMEDPVLPSPPAGPTHGRGHQDAPASLMGRIEAFWTAASRSSVAWAAGIAVNVVVAAAAANSMFLVVDVSRGEPLPWWRAYDLELIPDFEKVMNAFLAFLLPRVFGTLAVLIVVSGLRQAVAVLVWAPRPDATEDVPGEAPLPARDLRLSDAAAALWALLVAAACLVVLGASSHVMAVSLLRGVGTPRTAVPFAPILAERAAKALHNWHVASPYGLFRRMTGVGGLVEDPLTGVKAQLGARPEIVLEGTRDQGRSWHVLPFQHKPTDVERTPTLAIPHQPRLDWQMWFAALGTYQTSPWTLTLADKLLEGSPDVTALLDTERWPFVPASGQCGPSSSETATEASDCVLVPGGKAVLRPLALRARLVQMDFSRLDTPWHRLQLLEPAGGEATLVNQSLSELVSSWALRAFNQAMGTNSAEGDGTRAPWWVAAGAGSASPAGNVGPVQGGTDFLPAITRGHAGIASALTQIRRPRISPAQRATMLAERASCDFASLGEPFRPAGPVATWLCKAVEWGHAVRAWRLDVVALAAALCLMANRLLLGAALPDDVAAAK